MLLRKTLREIRKNCGQFISIFLLAAIAIMLFTTFQSSTTGADIAFSRMEKKTNIADVWMYGEDFRSSDLKAVRELDDVKDAQLRTSVTAKSVKQGNAQVDVYLQDENRVSKPEVLDGRDFDAEDTDGLWLSVTFAKAWDLKVGDRFAYKYNGVTVEKTIRGLIASPEYIYQCASEDLDTDLKNIAYVWMPYKGFPVRKYIESQIKSGKLTASDILDGKDIAKNTDVFDKMKDQLKAVGLTADDITKNMMLDYVDDLSDSRLYDMIPYTQLIFTTDRSDVFDMESEISGAIDGNYAVYIDSDSIPGIKKFQDEMNQHRQFSFGFCAIFMLIALLVIVTSMKRMVSQQRTQIGTMNAMGMKRHKIVLHYVSYSFIVSLAGSVLGLILGPKVLGRWFVGLFGSWYTVPGWHEAYSWNFIAMAAVTVIVCCLAAYLSCRKLLKVHPSEALRPAPPKAGKRCIFEHLPFWGKLSFHTQYNLRDISRSKLRTFMAVFGTACGMMLTVCGVGCNDMLDNVENWTFEKLQDYSCEAVLKENITEKQADRLAGRYGGELVMSGSIEIAAERHSDHDSRKTGTLTVTEGKGMYNVTDTSQNVVKLKKGTVAVTMKTAETLGLSEGDTVWWHVYDKNEWHKSEVGLINRNPVVSGLTMLRSDFEKSGEDYEPTMLVTDEKIKDDSRYITAVHDRRTVKESFESNMEMMYLMVYLLMGFSALLVVIVLYNSGNLSFNERVREFATLKVLGYRSERIRRLLTLQNCWLSLIGILIGAPFGRVLLQYMLDSNGDSYDYIAVIGTKSYIIAGAFVLLVSVLVSFMFSKRIKRLDMAGALKGAE